MAAAALNYRQGLLRAACTVVLGLAAAAVVPDTPAHAQGSPRDALAAGKRFNYFISGHSLTDNPLPEFIAGIALSQGRQSRWNQQNVVGSPISWRTWGGKGNWGGYREGKNANYRNDMDVVRELRERQGPDAYDALIVAEGHNTSAVLRYHDTVRYLRHFHERLIEGNPKGMTFLYEPWEGINDLSDPAPWVKLERDASKLWGCVVERINMSLQHEGRQDRLGSLPIGAALTDLVEQATKEPVAGISGTTVTETMKTIFQDSVHLSRVGIYYAALLTYIGVTGETLKDAWHPSMVTSEQAKSLQQTAQKFYQSRAAEPKPTLAACRQLMTDSFCDDWNKYVPSKWVGPVLDCKPYFSRATSAAGQFGAQNLFVFDPLTDASYWLPAPAR